MTVTPADIEAATRLIEGELVRTPCVEAPSLSAASGAKVCVKLECLQAGGSFKARGALVKLRSLTAEQRTAGVVAMSAGNHAQGVAWQAQRLGIPATIVMPRGTPFTKVQRTEALGATVVLEGETLSEAGGHALALGDKHGLTFVHPYDDPRIIAGQGTVGLEMLADRPDIDCLIVPIGGGGLAAGVAVAAKAMKPGIEIIGVQCALYPSMREAIRGEAPSSAGQTLAEGIAVKAPGTLTRPIIERLVDDIVLADEAALEAAVEMMIGDAKLVAEGAGAAPLAALLADKQRFAGRTVGLVLSGGNIDARLLASILLRGLARAGRMARLRIEINDAPGVLSKVAGMIGEGGGNIIEIYHQRLFYDVPVKFAEVDVVIETLDTGHVRTIIERLQRNGYPARLLGSTADGG